MERQRGWGACLSSSGTRTHHKHTLNPKLANPLPLCFGQRVCGVPVEARSDDGHTSPQHPDSAAREAPLPEGLAAGAISSGAC